MSEVKRVSFTTLSGGPLDSITSNSSKKSSFNATAAALLQGHHEAFAVPSTPSASLPAADTVTQTSQQSSKTFRLDLELFEPNSNTFPEFNYSKLIHLEKKKLKKLSKLNGISDPFEENDDDVVRIAKELEKKYGSVYGRGGNSKSKKDDYYDKGAGYDESDSFIDNTEAYDEIIPEEVETVEGGFYINSGQLEFKHLSNYERTDEIIKMPKTATKKRALSTSSSSGDDDDDDDDEQDEVQAEAEWNSSPKDTSSGINKLKNGHMDKKLKINEDRESLKVKNKEKKIEKVKEKDDLKEDDIFSDSGKEKDREKAVKTTTVKDMLKAKRDSFRKMQEGEGKVKLNNGEIIKGMQSTDATSDSSGDDSDSEEEPNEKKFRKMSDEDPDKMRSNDVKLSEDLPEDIAKDIVEMKNIAKLLNQTGKHFQFDDNITELFLRIDDACLCLDKSIRNQVFAHLEYQMSLPKYFLLRKAKQLRIKQEKSKTKKAYMKLKKAVAEVMPSVVLNYEANYRKVEEFRSSIPPEEFEKMEHPPKYPKKKFPWTEPFRNLLYELFQVRWTSFTVLRTRKETFEDFVNNYLRDKVVPIWPTGWMKIEDLKKELEKRKMSAKKPKENKKPGDLSIINKNKLNDETSITIVEKPLDGNKSILASNNSLSVMSTKDLVVTITTKGNEKSSEVPNSNTPVNSVSITQISAEVGGSKDHTSTSLIKTDMKIHKSNSNCPRPSPLSTIAEESYAFSKDLGQNSTSGYSTQVKSNNKSNQVEKNCSNNSSNVNNHHKTTNNASKTPPDLVSPTKRATDHSISSIMSSTSQCTNQHSTAAVHGLPSSTMSSSVTTNKSLESNIATTTHVITVDNLKNASEIINTTNQLLNNSNPANNSVTSVSSSNPQKECPIRIRSVANVNSSVEKDLCLDSFGKSVQDKSDQESSSESDGVEIVGVYPVVAKKSLNVAVNKNKYGKSGNSNSRSGSPNQLPGQNLKKIKSAQNEGRRNAEQVIMSGEVKDAELDVNQIMRALKELEEMQQSNIHISGGSSPPSSSNRSVTNSHQSAISYGKDIKQ